MANKSTRRAVKTAERRRRVGELYLGGKTQPEIGVELSVSQATVSLDLKYLRAEWLNSSLIDFSEAKSRELANIDRLEREAWVGYSDSKMSQGIKSKHPGDPKWLDKIQWCIEQRLKIFGVYAAQRVDMTWREYAEKSGVDAGRAFEALVQYYAAENARAVALGSGNGSLAPTDSSGD
jgi:DNA-binding transcriptional regulator LsrR (DeoR family)